jgi:hypothetical protein
MCLVEECFPMRRGTETPQIAQMTQRERRVEECSPMKRGLKLARRAWIGAPSQGLKSRTDCQLPYWTCLLPFGNLQLEKLGRHSTEDPDLSLFDLALPLNLAAVSKRMAEERTTEIELRARAQRDRQEIHRLETDLEMIPAEKRLTDARKSVGAVPAGARGSR